MSDFISGLENNLFGRGNILNRKIDFQREKFLKGISNTRHGKKEDPTYLYFRFIFDFGENYFIDPETFLPTSPLFRSDPVNREDENLKKNINIYISKIHSAKKINSESEKLSDFDKIYKAIKSDLSSYDGGFYSDIDFFYGSKAKINGLLNNNFFNINGDGLAYMGAQQFLGQRSIKRKEMLNAFKKGINYINRNCPYYFQSLSGLDNLLKTEIRNYHKQNYVFKRAGTLTIDCLESIDMRMFSLAELYRKAVYDFTYHRVMLPENLRKFRMWLVITELRNIQLSHNMNDILNPFSIPSIAQGVNFLSDFNSQTGLLNNASGLFGKPTNVEEENYDDEKFATYTLTPYAFVYQFDQCEFDFDNTFPSYSTIDNKGGQAVTCQFKIHVGRVKDYKIQFNLLSDIIEKDDNIKQMVLSDIWGGIQNNDKEVENNNNYLNYDYFQTSGIGNISYSDKPDPKEYFTQLASNFILNTVADLKNQGVSLLQNKLLGNIYGFGGINII